MSVDSILWPLWNIITNCLMELNRLDIPEGRQFSVKEKNTCKIWRNHQQWLNNKNIYRQNVSRLSTVTTIQYNITLLPSVNTLTARGISIHWIHEEYLKHYHKLLHGVKEVIHPNWKTSKRQFLFERGKYVTCIKYDVITEQCFNNSKNIPAICQ